MHGETLTRRDRSAMVALRVLIDCTQWQFGTADKNVDEIGPRELAKEAYAIADAMERTRKSKRRKRHA